MIKLRAELAQQIVEQLGRLVDGAIAVADETGGVVATTDARLTQCPQRFALRVMKTGQLCEAIPEEFPANARPDSHGDQLFGLPLVYDGRTAGAMLISGERERVRTIARYLEALAEAIVRQVAVVAQIPQQPELKDKFLYDLLHAERFDDPARRIEEAAVLGMDLATPRAALVLAVAPPTPPPPSAPPPRMRGGGRGVGSVRPFNTSGNDPTIAPGTAEPSGPTLRSEQKPWLIGKIARAFDPPGQAVVGHLGNNHFAVLLAIDPARDEDRLNGAARDLVQTLADLESAPIRAGVGQTGATSCAPSVGPGALIRVGVGRYWAGLEGLARSYREAALALEAGSRLSLPGPIYTLADVSLGVFVGDADQATKIDLAGRLVDGLGIELVETVRALLDADLSVSGAAGRLNVHRHTLLYRLAKLQRTTGRDLRHFWDALPLALALTLLRMDQARAE